MVEKKGLSRLRNYKGVAMTTTTGKPMKAGEWFRTCQECGNKQRAKEPEYGKKLTDSYREAQCRRCHSPALDYGTYHLEDEE